MCVGGGNGLAGLQGSIFRATARWLTQAPNFANMSSELKTLCHFPKLGPPRARRRVVPTQTTGTETLRRRRGELSRFYLCVAAEMSYVSPPNPARLGLELKRRLLSLTEHFWWLSIAFSAVSVNLTCNTVTLPAFCWPQFSP